MGVGVGGRRMRRKRMTFNTETKMMFGREEERMGKKQQRKKEEQWRIAAGEEVDEAADVESRATRSVRVSETLDKMTASADGMSAGESTSKISPDTVSKILEATEGASTNAEKKAPPLLKRGQWTAVLSGVVAVVLGVGYLLLAALLDSREMLPPPPEAMQF